MQADFCMKKICVGSVRSQDFVIESSIVINWRAQIIVVTPNLIFISQLNIDGRERGAEEGASLVS